MTVSEGEPQNVTATEVGCSHRAVCEMTDEKLRRKKKRGLKEKTGLWLLHKILFHLQSKSFKDLDQVLNTNTVEYTDTLVGRLRMSFSFY